ncbi:MAG: hypothetical protein JNJ45_12650 [Chthonomonas sp.]|nr:hypothetical protein [Chthonomonas sp.]
MFSRTTLHVVLVAVAVFLVAVILSDADQSDFRPRELSAKGHAAISMYIEPARAARKLQRKYDGKPPPLDEIRPVAELWADGVDSGILLDCESEGPGDTSLDGAKAQIFSLRQYLSASLAACSLTEFQAGRMDTGANTLLLSLRVSRAVENCDLRTYAATLAERNRMFRRFGPILDGLDDNLRAPILAFGPGQAESRLLGNHLLAWVSLIDVDPQGQLAEVYGHLGKLISDDRTQIEDIDRVLAPASKRIRDNANWLFVGKIAWTNLAEMRENTAAIRNRAFSPTPNLPYRALMSSSATR